jgi:hypothetical protein
LAENPTAPKIVMPGLVPGIHAVGGKADFPPLVVLDGRDKPGYDGL